MHTMLKSLCKSNEYISLYSNYEDPSRFHFGRILAVSDDKLVFQMVAPNGRPDGIALMELSRVFRVDRLDEYCVKMEILMKNYVMPKYDIDYSSDLLTDILAFAEREKKIISIEIDNSEIENVQGIIESFDNEICSVKMITGEGKENGAAIILTQRITMITLDREEEQLIKYLRDLED